MGAPFTDALARHGRLSQRRVDSEATLKAISSSLRGSDVFRQSTSAFVFSAGSLARLDAGQVSDWDPFVVINGSKANRSNLSEIRLMAAMVAANTNLQFADFSNDGKFLKVHYTDDLCSIIGTPQDDSDNAFTTRMLLILESKCSWNRPAYHACSRQVISTYFRDSKGRETFRLLFLLNDILRYWRTLCLNYETIRNDKSWPWRKKNINLKFSRMLSVFSTVLAITTELVRTEADLMRLIHFSPMERLAMCLDMIGDQALMPPFRQMLNDYEKFLEWKEINNVDALLKTPAMVSERLRRSERFANFWHGLLLHKSVAPLYKRYLVL